jgi:hypothetical protein
MIARKVPRTIHELEPLAKDIFLGIIKEYIENDKGRQFGDSFSNNETGLIYRCSGTISLLLLVNTFNGFANIQDWKDIVLDEFNKVVEYINLSGFDATPVIANRNTANIFSPTSGHYIDSVTWVLSFAILIRYTARSGHITLTPVIMNEVIETIKHTLRILCDSQCEAGGWGFTQGCSEPDLYFSSAVSDALGDLGDYVLGESPELTCIDSELVELLSEMPDKLLDEITTARKNLAGWLIRDYLPKLGETMIAPKGSDINSNDYNTLYYTYFIITILTTTKASKLYFPEKSDEIGKKIEHAIYISRIHFDKAYEDKNYWDDPDLSSLNISWKYNKNLDAAAKRAFQSGRKPVEPGLVPLSLRCNILYAFYYARGVDNKIEQLFNIILDDRNEINGLWDRQDYVLQITERAVEAIVDYADYLQEFCSGKNAPSVTSERCYDMTSPSDGMFRKAILEALNEILNSPDGIQLISEALTKAMPPEQSTDNTFTEVQLARQLTSMLTKRRQLLYSDKNPNNNNSETMQFKALDERIRDFLLETIADRMKAADHDITLDHNQLIEKLSIQEKKFYGTFAYWLASDPILSLGDLFTEVASTATTARQQADMNNNKKGKSS